MAEDVSNFPTTYAAFFAPRTHKFETVDFRVPTSPANLQTYFANTTKQRVRQGRLAGLLGVAIGIVVAIIGFAVDQLTRGLTLASYRAAALLFRDNKFWAAVVVFVLISSVYVIIAAILVVYVAPLGAGSGIPELKSYLNGVRVPGFLAMNSLFVKAIGVAFSIASGLICGKQGPVIHAGAIVGAGMSQAASSRFRWRLSSSAFRFLRTEAWKRDFTAVGAAVGVAVAFGSPMGAWMWVYEEACTHWTWTLGIITLGGCLSGAIVVRILNYLATGLPSSGFGTFTVTQFGKLVTPFGGTEFPLKDIPAFILIGALGGTCGALLPFVNRSITLFRYKRVTKPVRRIIESVLIGILTAAIRIIIPQLADDCRDVNPDMEEVLQRAPMQDFSQFTCPPSQFSPWAAVLYNPTDTVVRALLFTTDSIFPAGGVGTAFAYFFVFIIWTYGIAVPAGVFFPGFLLGSVYGRLIGIAVQAIFPSRTDVSLTGYAFLGAVSALAGFTRTISVAVIALEATAADGASFAAVLVALVAKLVGDFLHRRGIYDLHIDLKGIPFLSSEVPQLESYQKLRVADVMSTTVIGVRRLSRVSGLLRMLGTNDHHAFPVFLKVVSVRTKTKQGNSSHGFNGEDEVEDADAASVSSSSILEAELDEKENGGNMTLQPASSIVTPTHVGLQATIFDEGQIRLVQLTDHGEAHVTQVSRHGGSRREPRRRFSGFIVEQIASSSTDSQSRTTTPLSSPSRSRDSRGTKDSREPEIPDFELMGTIDRGTLLALLKHECDKHEKRKNGDDVRDDDQVPRDDLDSAWPNTTRLKADSEKELVKRVKECKLDERVIDLKPYIDPDPLLMSDKAFSMAAYDLFRRTGSRHILVANTRVGRIAGIVTRKDILPQSITDVLQKYEGIKIE